MTFFNKTDLALFSSVLEYIFSVLGTEVGPHSTLWLLMMLGPSQPVRPLHFPLMCGIAHKRQMCKNTHLAAGPCFNYTAYLYYPLVQRVTLPEMMEEFIMLACQYNSGPFPTH